jgi:PAS domain S-box-containing protein
MYFTYLFLLGLAVFCNIALIGLLYHRTQRNITIVSLVVLLSLVDLWFLPKFITNALLAQGIWFETLSRVAALGYIFVPVAFLIFSLSYGNYFKPFYKVYFWLLILFPPIIFLYLSWTSDLVGVHSALLARFYPWGYETPTGQLWPIYVAWFDSMILIAIGVLIYHYRHLEDSVKKRQSYFVIHAASIPLILDTITIGILPHFNIFVFPVGVIVLNIMTFVGVYAIYIYKFFVVSPNTVLASLNQAIITVDNKGAIIQLNPYSERLLGVSTTQVLGQDLEKVLLIQNSQINSQNFQFSSLLKPVFSKGKSLNIDAYSIVNRNKEVFPSTISITPIFSKKEIIGANIFLLDTTKVKEIEKQKEDWFSMLSHELKSPLTTIKAYNQLLAANLAGDVQSQKLLLNMDGQIDKLQELVKDFFELSRLHSGNIRLDREYLELDELVRKVIKNMQITYPQRKFVLKGRTSSIIFADNNSIEQILTNFITNAIKYSPGDKKIEVLLTFDEKSVSVGVRDFGQGIPQNYQKRVFNPFYRIRKNTKGKSGLGIGLFIAANISKAHDGKVWVESVEGEGSTFFFSMPKATPFEVDTFKLSTLPKFKES